MPRERWQRVTCARPGCGREVRFPRAEAPLHFCSTHNKGEIDKMQAALCDLRRTRCTTEDYKDLVWASAFCRSYKCPNSEKCPYSGP